MFSDRLNSYHIFNIGSMLPSKFSAFRLAGSPVLFCDYADIQMRERSRTVKNVSVMIRFPVWHSASITPTLTTFFGKMSLGMMVKRSLCGGIFRHVIVFLDDSAKCSSAFSNEINVREYCKTRRLDGLEGQN